MSLILDNIVEEENAPVQEDFFIHLFPEYGKPAYCGSTYTHQECYNPSRWPGGWPDAIVIIKNGGKCPTCGKLLCIYCETHDRVYFEEIYKQAGL